MILVADASFAAKLVIDEVDSDIAREWWEDRVPWAAPAIIGPEVQSALQMRHRMAPEDFPADRLAQATDVWSAVLSDIHLHVIDREIGDHARRLQQQHPLRGADACYLALAEQLSSRIDPALFASFDDQQREAARARNIPLAPS